MEPNTRPRIGIVWSGQAKTAYFIKRAIGTEHFVPLLLRQDCEWVSLQFPGEPEVIQNWRQKGISIQDPMSEVKDFADTAAIISTLDLVICAETAPAHLAGALGKPVWVMNRVGGDWRWLQGQSETPWYPGMRVFSLPNGGETWDSVIAEVSKQLDHWLIAKKAQKLS